MCNRTSYLQHYSFGDNNIPVTQYRKPQWTVSENDASADAYSILRIRLHTVGGPGEAHFIRQFVEAKYSSAGFVAHMLALMATEGITKICMEVAEENSDFFNPATPATPECSDEDMGF